MNCNDVARLKLDIASQRDAKGTSCSIGRLAGGRVVYGKKGCARQEQQISRQVLIGALHLAGRTN